MTKGCVRVCNADLKNDLMTEFTVTELTANTDDCNKAVLLTDDPGLIDITDPTSGGYLDTANRMRLISSLPEAGTHYGTTSETYAALSDFFANATTRGVRECTYVLYWDRGNESIATALEEANCCNNCWKHLAMVHTAIDGTSLLDGADAEALADWAVTNDKIPYLHSKDPDSEDPNNTTNMTANLFNNGIKDVFVVYSQGQCCEVTNELGEVEYFADGDPVLDENDDPVLDGAGEPVISDGTYPMIKICCKYTEYLAAGWVSNVDFDRTGSGYTIAYKPQGGQGWIGVQTSEFDNGQVTGATGFTPSHKIITNNNGHANVYIQSEGYPFIYPGVTVGGKFLDEIHLRCFIKRRMKQVVAQAYINSRCIGFDERGQAIKRNNIAREMRRFENNELFTTDFQNFEQYGARYRDRGTGWVMFQDRISNLPIGDKRCRRATQIRLCYIPRGCDQFSPIELCVLIDAEQLSGIGV